MENSVLVEQYTDLLKEGNYRTMLDLFHEENAAPSGALMVNLGQSQVCLQTLTTFHLHTRTCTSEMP